MSMSWLHLNSDDILFQHNQFIYPCGLINLLFNFQKIDPTNIRDFFGTTSDASKTSDSAYILFYQACDASAVPSDIDTLPKQKAHTSPSPRPSSPPPLPTMQLSDWASAFTPHHQCSCVHFSPAPKVQMLSVSPALLNDFFSNPENKWLEKQKIMLEKYVISCWRLSRHYTVYFSKKEHLQRLVSFIWTFLPLFFLLLSVFVGFWYILSSTCDVHANKTRLSWHLCPCLETNTALLSSSLQRIFHTANT